jgi:hypothetical protein
LILGHIKVMDSVLALKLGVTLTPWHAAAVARDSGGRRRASVGERVDAEVGEVWSPFGWRNRAGSSPVVFSIVTCIG